MEKVTISEEEQGAHLLQVGRTEREIKWASKLAQQPRRVS